MWVPYNFLQDDNKFTPPPWQTVQSCCHESCCLYVVSMGFSPTLLILILVSFCKTVFPIFDHFYLIGWGYSNFFCFFVHLSTETKLTRDVWLLFISKMTVNILELRLYCILFNFFLLSGYPHSTVHVVWYNIVLINYERDCPLFTCVWYPPLVRRNITCLYLSYPYRDNHLECWF